MTSESTGLTDQQAKAVVEAALLTRQIRFFRTHIGLPLAK